MKVYFYFICFIFLYNCLCKFYILFINCFICLCLLMSIYFNFVIDKKNIYILTDGRWKLFFRTSYNRRLDGTEKPIDIKLYYEDRYLVHDIKFEFILHRRIYYPRIKINKMSSEFIFLSLSLSNMIVKLHFKKSTLVFVKVKSKTQIGLYIYNINYKI